MREQRVQDLAVVMVHVSSLGEVNVVGPLPSVTAADVALTWINRARQGNRQVQRAIGLTRPCYCPRIHDQGIGAIRHAPPLRIVVGLELPDIALGRRQHLSVIEPPRGFGAKAATAGSHFGFKNA
jgi:hypothetical protein